jgi:hypothetical protein
MAKRERDMRIFLIVLVVVAIVLVCDAVNVFAFRKV